MTTHTTLSFPMNVKENAATIEALLNARTILRQVHPQLADVPAGMNNGQGCVNAAIGEITAQIASVISHDILERTIAVN